MGIGFRSKFSMFFIVLSCGQGSWVRATTTYLELKYLHDPPKRMCALIRSRWFFFTRSQVPLAAWFIPSLWLWGTWLGYNSRKGKNVYLHLEGLRSIFLLFLLREYYLCPATIGVLPLSFKDRNATCRIYFGSFFIANNKVINPIPLCCFAGCGIDVILWKLTISCSSFILLVGHENLLKMV